MNQFGRIIPIGIGLAMCVSIVVAFYVPQNDTIPKKRGARNALANAQKWTDGVIPYIFAEDIDEELQDKFLDYMIKLADITGDCISFREKVDSDISFIRIEHTNADGCEAVVGKQWGPQTLSLGEGCEDQGTFFHEILHVIGFKHEHSRPDRETYVVVLEDNIVDGKSDNFEESNAAEVTTLDLLYDYYSIMHYDVKAFTKDKVNGLPTIAIVNQNVEADLIGESQVLTLLDILKVKRYYNCIEPTTKTLKITLKEARNYNLVIFNSDKLVADSSAILKVPMEQRRSSLFFEISFNDDSTVCLKSLLNNNYVSVDDADGFLKANSNACDSDSARFYMPRSHHGVYMLRSKANLRYIKTDGSLSLKAIGQPRSSAARFYVQVSK